MRHKLSNGSAVLPNRATCWHRMNLGQCTLQEKEGSRTTGKPSNGSGRPPNRAMQMLNTTWERVVFLVPARSVISNRPRIRSPRLPNKVIRALQMPLGECLFSAMACRQTKLLPLSGFDLQQKLGSRKANTIWRISTYAGKAFLKIPRLPFSGSQKRQSRAIRKHKLTWGTFCVMGQAYPVTAQQDYAGFCGLPRKVTRKGKTVSANAI